MTSTRPTHLSAAQSDRAAGVLFGHAAGDALGAGYEFGPPLPETESVSMIGGGTVRLGAWGVDRRHADGRPGPRRRRGGHRRWD